MPYEVRSLDLWAGDGGWEENASYNIGPVSARLGSGSTDKEMLRDLQDRGYLRPDSHLRETASVRDPMGVYFDDSDGGGEIVYVMGVGNQPAFISQYLEDGEWQTLARHHEELRFYDRGEAENALREAGHNVLGEDDGDNETGRILEEFEDWPVLRLDWIEPWWTVRAATSPSTAEFRVEIQRSIPRSERRDVVEIVRLALNWAYPDDDDLIELVLGAETPDWRDPSTIEFDSMKHQTLRAIRAWINAGEPNGE